LNIGYNPPGAKRSIKEEINKDKNALQPTRSLDEAIVDFLHDSDTLLHFDMSGLGLQFESYKKIAEKGIRKSRTLLAIHMSGMGL